MSIEYCVIAVIKLRGNCKLQEIRVMYVYSLIDYLEKNK